ncbi:MAG: hypothetical protein M1837_000317 [Sclerophora amabilis]|nr:MAG: hypothetical protein M1837_000317 [Sclerophora amabilis]
MHFFIFLTFLISVHTAISVPRHDPKPKSTTLDQGHEPPSSGPLESRGETALDAPPQGLASKTKHRIHPRQRSTGEETPAPPPPRRVESNYWDEVPRSLIWDASHYELDVSHLHRLAEAIGPVLDLALRKILLDGILGGSYFRGATYKMNFPLKGDTAGFGFLVTLYCLSRSPPSETLPLDLEIGPRSPEEGPQPFSEHEHIGTWARARFLEAANRLATTENVKRQRKADAHLLQGHFMTRGNMFSLTYGVSRMVPGPDLTADNALSHGQPQNRPQRRALIEEETPAPRLEESGDWMELRNPSNQNNGYEGLTVFQLEHLARAAKSVVHQSFSQVLLRISLGASYSAGSDFSMDFPLEGPTKGFGFQVTFFILDNSPSSASMPLHFQIAPRSPETPFSRYETIETWIKARLLKAANQLSLITTEDVKQGRRVDANLLQGHFMTENRKFAFFYRISPMKAGPDLTRRDALPQGLASKTQHTHNRRRRSAARQTLASVPGPARRRNPLTDAELSRPNEDPSSEEGLEPIIFPRADIPTSVLARSASLQTRPELGENWYEDPIPDWHLTPVPDGLDVPHLEHLAEVVGPAISLTVLTLKDMEEGDRAVPGRSYRRVIHLDSPTTRGIGLLLILDYHDRLASTVTGSDDLRELLLHRPFSMYPTIGRWAAARFLEMKDRLETAENDEEGARINRRLLQGRVRNPEVPLTIRWHVVSVPDVEEPGRDGDGGEQLSRNDQV